MVGNHENTEVGTFLSSYLDVDVTAITKRLQAAAYWSAGDNVEKSSVSEKYAWMGDKLGSNVRIDDLDSYHGDFKKRSLEECGCGSLH